MKCPNNNTVKQTGQEGDCVFCEHTTGKGGTPWPEGGVVCPCCIPLGIAWRAKQDS